MRLVDVIEEAKVKGYTKIHDGKKKWRIDDFKNEVALNDEGDYVLLASGEICEFEETGFNILQPSFRAR